MTLASMPRHRPGRAIVHRTKGHGQGYITRLMSPSDLGQFLKPFVFLDLFAAPGAMAANMGLHPHSGIATVTYLFQGSVGYEDTDGRTGVLGAGGLEWMKAGGGTWHGGAPGGTGQARGFQLWLALPPELESGPAESIYLPAAEVPSVGPVNVLLGSYGAVSSKIVPPTPLSYLAIHLKAGERWRFQPAAGHDACWVAVASGSLMAAEEIGEGEMAVFAPSDQAIEFEARQETRFVLGSAIPHPHELVLGSYSVHTSAAALRQGEARISELGSERRASRR